MAAAPLYSILLIVVVSQTVWTYPLLTRWESSSNVPLLDPEIRLMVRQADGADSSRFRIQRLRQGLAGRLRYRTGNEQLHTQIDHNCFMSPVQCLLHRGAKFLL